MKKLIALMCMIMGVSLAAPMAEAKNGDVIGKAYNTDIVVYVNNYAVSSFAVNGTSCIVAEDLRNLGFDVVWNGDARSLSISRNSETVPFEMTVKKTGKPGSVFANILETDIKVYANDTQIPSYALNGYTIVPVESLTMMGEIYWVADERALKVWVDGLKIRDTMQPVEQYVEPVQPTYTSSGSSGGYTENTSISYVGNANSKKFHRSTCSSVSRMKNSNKVYLASRDEAVRRGYTPCKNCRP